MAKTRKTNSKEWAFCYEYVRTGDKVKAVEIAYESQASRTRHDKASFANKLLSRPAVANEIAAMQQDLRSSQRLTLDQHLNALAELRDRAADGEQYAAAVRAEELRGRVLGYYVEQHLHVHETPASRDEIAARIRSLLESNPRLRELMSMLPGGETIKQIDSQSVESLPIEDRSSHRTVELHPADSHSTDRTQAPAPTGSGDSSDSASDSAASASEELDSVLADL